MDDETEAMKARVLAFADRAAQRQAQEIEDLQRRVAALEREVAAIKRVRVVAQSLTAQEMHDALHAKMGRTVADKAVRLREDK